MALPRGRPKGAKAKFSAQARENVVAVFNKLGGTAAMAKWAEANQTEFYQLYARLLPKEVVADIVHHDASSLSDGELERIATGRGEGTAAPEAGEEDASSVH